MSAAIVAAAARAEAWLAAHPPISLLGWTDQVLGLTVRRGPAGEARLAELLGWGEALTGVITRGAAAGTLGGHVTTALIAWDLLARYGRPVEEIAAAVAPLARAASAEAEGWSEPGRSVFFYWAARRGLGEAPPPGTDPADPVACAYHLVHRLLYGCEYGAATLTRGPASELLARLEVVAAHPDNLGNADLLGERLWIERALTPPDPARQRALALELLALQQPAGDFAVRGDAEARSHVVVVAAAAWARWGQ